MFNRMHNATNPNQGPAEKVLCVCSAGLLRSPTTAAVMWEMGYNTRAAGCMEDYALIPVDEVLIHWAEKIVVMEDWQAINLLNRFKGYLKDKDVYSFNVPDMYQRNDPELKDIIRQRVNDMEEHGYYKYELLQEEPSA